MREQIDRLDVEQDIFISLKQFDERNALIPWVSIVYFFEVTIPMVIGKASRILARQSTSYSLFMYCEGEAPEPISI